MFADRGMMHSCIYLWCDVPDEAPAKTPRRRRKYLVNNARTLHVRGSSSGHDTTTGMSFSQLQHLSITFKADTSSR
ncbi:hypothetical protein K470DRAFT_255773 [Piedraia hortae CBS 480.64]|uniref:Uncharacterized protein n=1 Tax=Piedraia hortae CBS 480.64 TaxID=1314780 RepID=A0A6A7C4P4_9PEZI|nr:hypothetical protein K470DRAFT_255773 [Piedraia hortae CBS 480.64]